MKEIYYLLWQLLVVFVIVFTVTYVDSKFIKVCILLIFYLLDLLGRGYYEKMNNVYYIKVHPYVHNLTFHVLMTRFLGTTISKKMGVRQNRFVSYFNKHIHEYQYRFREKDEEEYELDGIISKRLFELLNEFFRPV